MYINKTIIYTEKKYILKMYAGQAQKPWSNEKEYIEQTPKSEAGARQIPLNQMAIETLECRKEWQERWKVISGKFYNKDGIVFSDEKGYYVQRQHVLAHLRKLLEKSGIENKHTIHDLRYTFCTLLWDNNVPAEITKELMGHSDVNVTLSIYTHAYNPKKVKFVDIVGNAIACV